MRGRMGSLLIREARRQASVFGVLQGASLTTGTSSRFILKSVLNSTLVNAPARSLISWSGVNVQLETRAWSPFVHHMSTSAAQKTESEDSNGMGSEGANEEKRSEKPTEMSSYWGVAPKVQNKEDGTPWKWTCFTPHETYYPDVTIDLDKTHDRKKTTDSIAYWTVKSMRIPADLYFQKRYDCRVMMLETVAAVPGMVGGMLLHLRSLRRFENSGGWIKALLEEAENERMHLMTFMEVAKPKWWERLLVLAVQGGFFNVYFLLYLVSPRMAHRVVGYLEEEAVWSYTQFLKQLDAGNIKNVPAPAIAIDYWRLPKDATLRDVVMVVRADEAHHRDVNHFAADIHEHGKELRESPAPIGYH